MRRKLLAVTLALALFAALGTVVLAQHDNNNPTDMRLYKNRFHYLGETLGGKNANATSSVSPGIYTITIFNQDKTRHEVEFKLGSTEFKTPVLNGGDTYNLNVTLTSGTWKVYCEIHGGGTKGMLFYLNVP